METCVEAELRYCSYMETCVQEELKLCTYVNLSRFTARKTCCVHVHSFSSSLNTNLHSNSCAFENSQVCCRNVCILIDRDLIRIH